MNAPRQNAPAKKKSPSANERKLADDLHTHQIELQMQNQELVRAKGELEQQKKS